jgi:hypothetical protein
MHEAVVMHGLEILHCHYALPHATSAWIAREMLRYHYRRAGSVIQCDHEVLDRAV